MPGVKGRCVFLEPTLNEILQMQERLRKPPQTCVLHPHSASPTRPCVESISLRLLEGNWVNMQKYPQKKQITILKHADVISPTRSQSLRELCQRATKTPGRKAKPDFICIFTEPLTSTGKIKSPDGREVKVMHGFVQGLLRSVRAGQKGKDPM